MNKDEKLAGIEQTLRNHLGTIRKLELAYGIAKADELEQGVAGNTPFLRSRGLLQQIEMYVGKAWTAQQKYNREAAIGYDIDFFQREIRANSVFVLSKKMLDIMMYKSDKISRGKIRAAKRRAAMRANPDQYLDGDSPILDIEERRRKRLENDPIVRQMLARKKNLVTSPDIMDILANKQPVRAEIGDNIDPPSGLDDEMNLIEESSNDNNNSNNS